MENELEIGLEDIFKGLKKRWYIIVTLTLICTIIAIVLSFFVIKPKYEASTKIFIGKEESENSGYDQSDVLMYQKLMKTYSEAIKTIDLVERSLENSNIDLEAEEVLDNLQVIALEDTQVLQIKYISTNPLEAKEIVENVSKEFIKKSKEMVSNGNTQIMESVKLPKRPISPNKKSNILIGFLLGTMLGCGIVILLEMLDNTFKSKEQIESELKTPVIGTTPMIKNNSKNDRFIVEEEPKSISVECYKTLRTNIQYSSFDKNYNVLLVTSSEPGEGKSTTAGNLALCLAQENKKVMLIDCDLRKPSLHKKFKISNIKGLSDVIIGKEKLSEVVYKHNEGLMVIPAGKTPPNPCEMLSSKAMSNLLEVLKSEFDYIILDAPPVQAVADSQILSTKVDGTVLVVKSEKTKKNSVENTLNLLKKVNANIIGIALNCLDINRNKYYYYYGENK